MSLRASGCTVRLLQSCDFASATFNPVWQNNRTIAAPRQAEVRATFDRSLDWLEHDKNTITASTNELLWRMIQQATEHSTDTRLREPFPSHEATPLRKNLRQDLAAAVLPGQLDGFMIRRPMSDFHATPKVRVVISILAHTITKQE